MSFETTPRPVGGAGTDVSTDPVTIAPAPPEDAPSPVAPSRLSPSALATYRGCPKQFWFKYVERVPERGRPSPQLVLANAVHHALERFFGLRPELRSLEVLHQALRWAWPQHRRSDSFGNREEEREYGLRALAMLEVFYDAFDTSAIPLARERWVQTRLQNGVTLFGKVDRIDGRVRANERSVLQLVDYKTGRSLLESADLAEEPAVQVYAAATEDEVGREVERVRYIYLGQADEARYDLEREDLELARQRLLAITDTIRADTAFEAVPGSHCSYCPFNLHCPDASRVELADLDVADDLLF